MRSWFSLSLSVFTGTYIESYIEHHCLSFICKATAAGLYCGAVKCMRSSRYMYKYAFDECLGLHVF